MISYSYLQLKRRTLFLPYLMVSLIPSHIQQCIWCFFFKKIFFLSFEIAEAFLISLMNLFQQHRKSLLNSSSVWLNYHRHLMPILNSTHWSKQLLVFSLVFWGDHQPPTAICRIYIDVVFCPSRTSSWKNAVH